MAFCYCPGIMTNYTAPDILARARDEARNQFKLAAVEGFTRPEGIALVMGNDAIIGGRTQTQNISAGTDAMKFLANIYGRELTFADIPSPAQGIKAIFIATSVSENATQLRQPTMETLAALRAYPGTERHGEVSVIAANIDRSFKLIL